MKTFHSDIPALFYAPTPVVGQSVLLEHDEARHLRALRLHLGDPVQLLDGAGRRSQAIVESMEKRRITVKVIHTALEEPESGLYIGLVIGVLADKSRMEWVVEKSVELGVEEIYPLRSEHTEGFYSRERLQRVARAALKQSQRSRISTLHEEVGWEDIEHVYAEFDTLALCHEQDGVDETLAEFVSSLSGNERVLLLVGPEGGFSEEEVRCVRRHHNGHILSLGNARLRSETAVVVALGSLQTMNM